MSKIEIVKNVCFYTDLTASVGNWRQSTNIQFPIEEIRIRQISYNGPGTEEGTFLIWSSLTNDFIASFAVLGDVNVTSNAVCITPGTIIRVSPNQIQSEVQFIIYTVNASGVAVPATSSLTGSLVINTDFIKYKI